MDLEKIKGIKEYLDKTIFNDVINLFFKWLEKYRPEEYEKMKRTNIINGNIFIKKYEEEFLSDIKSLLKLLKDMKESD